MDRNNQVTTAQLLTKAVRGINVTKSTRLEERNQLIGDVRMAIEELDNIRKYFEVVDDPELIDYAIYREKAAIMKLSYLLKKAKKNELLRCGHI